MTDNTENAITPEELNETHRILTKEILEGDDGYVVLETIFLQLTQQVYLTSHFTIPVLKQMDSLEAKLSDPTGFKASFNTFINHIRDFQRRLMVVHTKHKGKEGGGRPLDFPVMYAISEEYTVLMKEYDTVLHPLHLSLFGVIEKEAPELLAIDNEVDSDGK